ncbi:MAG: Sir2 silent information regulator family NAD-dependent deacetylase, partial [Prevotella sp.]|nr:Sir2 silent information regulator family NAD-dependent deacetylase [Prevotella sp.]
EDSHWHQQAQRYSDFVRTASDRRLLLLEFGVGFNTPVIIRFPFEQMASQFPDATLVRFNRDYPHPSLQGVKSFLAFTEDISRIIC